MRHGVLIEKGRLQRRSQDEQLHQAWSSWLPHAAFFHFFVQRMSLRVQAQTTASDGKRTFSETLLLSSLFSRTILVKLRSGFHARRRARVAANLARTSYATGILTKTDCHWTGFRSFFFTAGESPAFFSPRFLVRFHSKRVLLPAPVTRLRRTF